MKSNNKVLLVLIMVLLATNFGMLWYFTRESKVETKPVSRTERMGDMMRKELGFNDDQVQQYITLRLRRDSLMQPLNLELRQAKMNFLELLRQPNVPDSLVQKAALEVALKQAPIEVEFFQHFKRIQALCSQEQLGSFDSMLSRMVRRNTGDTSNISPGK